MKKFFKIGSYVILGFIIIGMGACMLLSEKMPEGQEGVEAEEWTDKMFIAVDKPGWDTTKIVAWNFMGIHDYIWNKETTDLQVSWGETEVTMNLNEYDGTVVKKGEVLQGDKKRKAIDKAYSFFCNDMFWLNAPVKARDEGTTRKLVNLEDGSKGLLVTYSSGGVTPGDSYLWLLDKSGLPTGWKMWTKILPVKGVYTSWEEWQTLDSGAKIATVHGNKLYNMKMSNIKSGQSYEQMGMPNPFQ